MNYIKVRTESEWKQQWHASPGMQSVLPCDSKHTDRPSVLHPVPLGYGGGSIWERASLGRTLLVLSYIPKMTGLGALKSLTLGMTKFDFCQLQNLQRYVQLWGPRTCLSCENKKACALPRYWFPQQQPEIFMMFFKISLPQTIHKTLSRENSVACKADLSMSLPNCHLSQPLLMIFVLTGVLSTPTRVHTYTDSTQTGRQGMREEIKGKKRVRENKESPLVLPRMNKRF